MFIRQLFTALCFFLCSVLLLGQTNPNHVYVKGYYRKDGTYVNGHYRTAPNSTNRDNFSTKGNYNPYTGKAGWVEPDNKIRRPDSSDKTYSESINSRFSSSKTINSLGQKVIKYSDGKEEFGLCKICSNVQFQEDLEYYWYTPNEGIQKTKGTSRGTLLDGEYKLFGKRGQLIAKFNYQKGLKHGNQMTWNDVGELSEKTHYTNGILDYAKFTNEEGYIVEWKGVIFENGSIKNIYNSLAVLVQTMTVEEGYKLHYKTYYDFGGRLKEEYTQDVLGDFHGSYITYHKNGKKEFTGHFEDGFRSGTWKWYDQSGNLESEVEYRIYTENHSNGNLKLKGSQYYNPNLRQWVKEDKWVYFAENGVDWVEVEYYEDGIVTKKKSL